ncbi:hypothetical protein B0J12DRAFT_205765 [Macrophomina phaseolina]|uniref:Uncharacterized protein n=1 Tax=Macrophomina phaseolina TaxID=35725 RepID=A0ABQ8G292_9PEZI|nr:hypothetical protein B0J12DRAFT_205765 [Macrophomina phaseolina]
MQQAQPPAASGFSPASYHRQNPGVAVPSGCGPSIDALHSMLIAEFAYTLQALGDSFLHANTLEQVLISAKALVSSTSLSDQPVLVSASDALISCPVFGQKLPTGLTYVLLTALPLLNILPFLAFIHFSYTTVLVNGTTGAQLASTSVPSAHPVQIPHRTTSSLH